MKRTKVALRCPADQYHGPQERIIEFSLLVKGELRGGLISFYPLDNGELRVDVYRTNGVRVVAERSLSSKAYSEAQEMQIGRALAGLLRLRRERGKDGWATGWGWKTSLGLFRMLRTIMRDVDAGDTHAVCKLDEKEAA